MAGASFRCEVVTPERALVAGQATALVCRTSDGELTVMALHTPQISDVVSGKVTIDTVDEGTIDLAVHGGFLQVATGAGADGTEGDGLSSKVTLLAGIAERIDEIDVERAQAALEAAQAILGDTQTTRGDDDLDEHARRLVIAEAEASAARAQLRLSLRGVSVS